eukprot:tig00020604_g11866.t1
MSGSTAEVASPTRSWFSRLLGDSRRSRLGRECGFASCRSHKCTAAARSPAAPASTAAAGPGPGFGSALVDPALCSASSSLGPGGFRGRPHKPARWPASAPASARAARPAAPASGRPAAPASGRRAAAAAAAAAGPPSVEEDPVALRGARAILRRTLGLRDARIRDLQRTVERQERAARVADTQLQLLRQKVAVLSGWRATPRR